MLNRQIKSKKVKNIIKKFDLEDGEEHQEEHESQPEEIQRQTKKSLKELLSGVMSKEVKPNQVILAEKNQLLQQVESQKQKSKEVGIKKNIKKAIVEKGHADPRSTTNKIQERELKMIAAKGLVKVFNVLKQMNEQANE